MTSDIKPEPKLALTVPLALWEGLAETTSIAYADSYLSGAVLRGNVLTPKTVTAYERLKFRAETATLLQRLGIELTCPVLASGSPSRPWSWPTDADLGEMSMRERIRNLRIMQDETRSKAGPMNASGEVRRPQFVAQAKVYAAKRLTSAA